MRAGRLAAFCALVLAACTGAPRPMTVPRSAAAPPPTDRLVMVTLPPAPERLWTRTSQDLMQVYGLRPVYLWPLASLGEQCLVYEVPEDRTAAAIAERLGADPRVRSAQPIFRFRVLAAPFDDPYAHLQYGLETLRLGDAHRWATGKGVRVAVVDTGLDLAHPDLEGRVARASNFVDEGGVTFTSDVHGTAVAGVIAARANNGVGIAGVAPDAEILALKACWQEPPDSREAVCNSYTLAKAVDSAIQGGARVLNFSLAGPHDPLLARILERALGDGIAVVAAADPASAEAFPASFPGVMPILASDPEGRLRLPPGRPAPAAAGSLAAPGVDVLTTVPQAGYDFLTGSSLAAAHVSGLAALLLELRPGLAPAELAALLVDTGRPGEPGAANSPPPPRLVDPCAALTRLLGREACG